MSKGDFRGKGGRLQSSIRISKEYIINSDYMGETIESDLDDTVLENPETERGPVVLSFKYKFQNFIVRQKITPASKEGCQTWILSVWDAKNIQHARIVGTVPEGTKDFTVSTLRNIFYKRKGQVRKLTPKTIEELLLGNVVNRWNSSNNLSVDAEAMYRGLAQNKKLKVEKVNGDSIFYHYIVTRSDLK